MKRFAFTLYLAFIVSILLAGCTAPAHLMHTSEHTPEPSPEKEMQQMLVPWHGKHISKAIREWGIPHVIRNTDTGSKIYIWQTPSLAFLQQAHRQIISSRQSVSMGRRITQTTGATVKMYQLMFYTRPNGTIYKTLAK